MKRYARDYLILLTSASLVLFLDQWTKAWVRANLTPGEVFRPELWITQYVRILHWKNTGTIGGFLPSMNNLFVVISFIIIFVILFYFPQLSRQERAARLGLCLMLGGVAGNLTDRLMRGQVTDFISIGNLPVLNIADASILIGIAILVVGLWPRKQKRTT